VIREKIRDFELLAKELVTIGAFVAACILFGLRDRNPEYIDIGLFALGISIVFRLLIIERELRETEKKMVERDRVSRELIEKIWPQVKR